MYEIHIAMKMNKLLGPGWRGGDLKSLFKPNVNVNKQAKIFAQIKAEISIGFDVDIFCLAKSVIHVVVG